MKLKNSAVFSVAIVAGMFLFAVFTSPSQGADFPDALAIAVANLPPDASNAGMGNCWAATPNFGSNSPAVTAMYPEDVKASVSGLYAIVNFKNGPNLNAYQGSVLARLPIGVAQVSYSNGASNTFHEVGDGYENSLKFNSLPSVDVQYGFKAAQDLFDVGDALYLGVGYLYSGGKISSRTVLASPATSWGNDLVSESTSHGVSGAATYQLMKKATLGVFYRHTWDKTEDNATILDGSFSENAVSRAESNQFRIGVSAQVTDLTLLALDFQHVNFYDDTRNASFDQWFAGIEQGIIKDVLYAYGGWAADGPTAGLGLYFPKGGINVAYMSKPFRDLEPFLGKAQMVMLSGYLNF